jgi:Uma2 family endonuclease
MQAQQELAQSVSRPMTEAQFDAWTGTDIWAEFKDGEVITKMPALLKHELLFKFLLILLDVFVTKKNFGIVIGSQYAARLRTGLRRVPDIMFVAQDRIQIVGERYVEGAPDLAVEIVSADSMARDWREKYLEYQAAGVREYWVFDPQSGYSEWYSLTQNGSYDQIPLHEGAYRSRILNGFYVREEWLLRENLPDPLAILQEWNII